MTSRVDTKLGRGLWVAALLCMVAPAAGCQWATALEPSLEPGERTVTVQGDRPVGEVYRFWTVGNVNRPYEMLERSGRRRLHGAIPFIDEANLVYLMGGREPDRNNWFLGVGEDGDVRADFSGMIAQLRATRAAGYEPRIVLDNVPYRMSDPVVERHYGNVAPPADERVWHAYVAAAVRAMVREFGRETVAAWTFRVGTEPDNRGHWSGTKEEFFAHYDYTVDAVTGVLPEATIGPGNIMNPNHYGRRDYWGLELIDHAANGTNACTGERGTRIDVFQLSWYPRVGWPLTKFDEAMGTIRERLDRYEQFRGVPIEAGEYAVLGDGRGRRLYASDTTEWMASFFAALADRVYDHGILQLYQWDQATFGVVHPHGRVIEMLGWMSGGRRLAVDVAAESAANCGAVACRKGEDLYVLVYNHRPGRENVPETMHLVVRDERMAAGDAWRKSAWRVDAEHGVWAYAFERDYRAAGLEPVKNAGLYEGAVDRLLGEAGLDVFHRNALKYHSLSQVHERREGIVVGNGAWTVTLEMPGHGVRLIRLSPETQAAAPAE